MADPSPIHYRKTVAVNLSNHLPPGFFWLNEPAEYSFDNGLIIHTDPETDFWQKTHYNFKRDNGHALLTRREGNFRLTACFYFDYKYQYDQCGLMVRFDAGNWIKVSAERENAQINRLGSVVTNLGYSDWATTDIPANMQVIWYRISRIGSDFILENSWNGKTWSQMRIAHLHSGNQSILAGVYACSPKESRFRSRITHMCIEA